MDPIATNEKTSCGTGAKKVNTVVGAQSFQALSAAPYFCVPLDHGPLTSNHELTDPGNINNCNSHDKLMTNPVVLANPNSTTSQIFHDLASDTLRQLMKIQVDAQLVIL